jgi:hypothetical protein
LKTFLRFILVLSLIIWLGGIIFFSFVTAPAVFSSLLPDGLPGLAARDIIRKSLHGLHLMGATCAVLFLISSAVLHRARQRSQLLVILMLTLTIASQYVVTRLIEVVQYDRDPAAIKTFNRLHSLSVSLEGTVLILGLVVVWLVIREIEPSA